MPHLAVDVDGTLTRTTETAALHPDTFDALRSWPGEVVVATGKVLPNALSIPRYVGVPLNAVAENGGVVYAAGELRVEGEGEATTRFADEYAEEHGSLGWGRHDLVNRWRETETAVAPEHPREQVEEVAARHGLDVVYTGYAYHVKSPKVDKATGLAVAADLLDVELEDFVAIGDSENDAEIFDVVGRSYAVANADDSAKAAADELVEGRCYEGFLQAVERALAL